MKVSTQKLLIAYTILLVITTIMSYILGDKFEARTIYAQLLTEGIIPFTLFVGGLLSLSLYGIYLILIQNKILRGVTFVIVNGFFFLLSSSTLILSYQDIGKFKEDKMIYQSVQDTTQKIILQCYTIGLAGGSEKYRLIQTSNMNASFRPIQLINTDDSIINSVKEGYKKLYDSKLNKTDSILTIEYKNQIYVFQK
jgi:hypothetical protein